MYFMVTKANCPFCVKAKALLDKEREPYDVVEVKDLKGLQAFFPEATTVPQISHKYLDISNSVTTEHVGGYTELVEYIKKWKKEEPARPKLKTTFNMDNKGFDSGEYPLFLGDQLGLTDTINQPYPIIENLYNIQMGQIWNHAEVDLTQDRQDMINADPKVVELMVKTIGWQWLADSIASRSITGTLLDYVTNSDLESWYNAVALFETIHAKTYSHIVKQTFLNPNEAIKQIYADMEIITRSNVLRDAFDDLANLPHDAPQEEKEDKLHVALAALYMLESLNFMASFAITFGIAETSIFQGIAQDVKLICRDEILHGKGGGIILNLQAKISKGAFERIRPKLKEIYEAVLKTELEWTDYLFSEGRHCPGINAERIKKYVMYEAQDVAKLLGIPIENPIEENPLPYMSKYIDSTKVQVAAQELQLTSYIVNPLQAPVNLNQTLAGLRETYS